MSFSYVALILAISIVSIPDNIKMDCISGEYIIIPWNRYRINTPAITRVDECTSADTGVGAAIAAGSQLEYGICALLVIAATIIPDHCHKLIGQVNNVLCSFRQVDSVVKITLLKSYCLSLYGCELWNLQQCWVINWTN